MITLEQKAEMYKMRQDGKTLQEIAEKYGVTRQAVNQFLDCSKRKIPRKSVLRCVYPHIRDWMIQEEISVKKLAAMMGINAFTLQAKLEGRNPFKQNEINALCGMTGETYEKLFQKQKQQEQKG